MKDPLKQGLKPADDYNLAIDDVEVEVKDPLKQGLKPLSGVHRPGLFWVEVKDPLKQGLKLTIVTVIPYYSISWSERSIKTRIETKIEGWAV